MNAQRKLQLAAAVVIANGLITLGMTPTVARAEACNDEVFQCDDCATSCPPKSGCSVVKQCYSLICGGNPEWFSTVCDYS